MGRARLLEEMLPEPICTIDLYTPLKLRRSFSNLTIHMQNKYKPKLMSTSFVYLMYCEKIKLYKIGYSIDVYRRLKEIDIIPSIKIKLVNKCEVIDAPHVEKLLHEYYKEFRVDREWFSLCREHVEDIKGLFYSRIIAYKEN
jgi:hypothetical protein